MAYSVMDKTFIMMQKFRLILVFMECHLHGATHYMKRELTSPLYSYMFVWRVIGVRMTYGHLGFYASHFSCLYHSMSWTSQRGYHGHGHGHDTHGDACGYRTGSDYYYGINTCVDPYPVF